MKLHTKTPMKAKALVLASTLVAMTAITSTHAAPIVLAGYDFTGSTLSATTEVGGTAGDFRIGTGLTGSGTDAGAGDPAPSVKLLGFSSVFSTNITADDYADFVFTPGVSGVDLERIEFDVAPSFTGNTRQVRVSYSFDGFATAGTILSTLDVSASTAFQLYSQSLTDESLNTTTSAVTFRIESEQGYSDARAIFVDNVAVYGAVIPEPGTLGLMLSALAGFAFLRMRRRK